MQDPGLAVGQHCWSQGEDRFSVAPHEALRSSSRLWGSSHLGVEATLTTSPPALPISQGVLGQFKRKEEPQKTADFLPMRHVGTDKIAMRAPVHSNYTSVQT